MGRAPCCDKAAVKRGPWSPEEDARLRSFIEQHGTGGNWIALPRKIGLKRCGKSCRLRWLNYLRPDIRHGGFSEEEDRIVCSLYIAIGSRWSIIAAQLPGRTDNDIKNYWNTRLKKKLFGGHPQSALTRHDHHRHASALMPLPAPLTSQTPCSSSSATTNVHVGGGLDMAATTVTGRSDTYVTMSGELTLHAPVAAPWWGDGGAFRTELDEIFRSGAVGSAPSAGGPGGALYTESAVSAGSTVTSASESVDWYQLDVQRYLGIP